MRKKLRAEVCCANRRLLTEELVTLTWGNVSGIDRGAGLVAIKPSGVPYDQLEPKHIVIVDLKGRIVEGDLHPSCDTPTHIRLYKAFDSIGGICHTHSRFATMFAQARRSIPPYGTTHADYFHGPVPVTRPLTPAEAEQEYENNTAAVILELFSDLAPTAMPAVLVAGHAPFTWGASANQAVDHAVALEAVAETAMGTRQINADATELEDYIMNTHYQRKHGPDAYYGQR